MDECRFLVYVVIPCVFRNRYFTSFFIISSLFIAARDARGSTEPARGGGFGGGRGGPGRGRGRGGFPSQQNREYGNGNANGFPATYGGSGVGGEEGDPEKPSDRERASYGGPRQPYRGGRRGGFRGGEAEGDSERPPRRLYERRSGTGRGSELKREGSGRGNWGTPTDDVLPQLGFSSHNNWVFMPLHVVLKRITPILIF